MTNTVYQLVFWLSLVTLVWTFVGYPALMILAVGRRPRHRIRGDYRPQVSVVLVAYNESVRLPRRIANLLNTDYPLELLEILVVSDGSDDGTAEVVRNMRQPRVRVMEEFEQRGKAACLNDAVAAASGEIVVFCDARQRFDELTIPSLVSRFSPMGGNQRPIGAVSGRLEIAEGGGAVAEGVGAYWKLERLLREAEGAFDSTIGCTGAVYAIRRELYEPIPEDTLLDDVVIPMQILIAGHRVVLEPGAQAFDPQELAADREEVRKRRTLAGGVQMLFRYPQWLIPWRNRCVMQLIAHKYLRLAGPFCMLLAAASNILLLGSGFYRFVALLHLGCYLFAFLGMTFERPKLGRLAASFVFLNLQVLRGIVYYFGGSWRSGWK